ncbi:hypothetical protein KVT40_008764 [Elsinoe batatas]|uniref:Zn(2)-C6 fungal-type domain-containing protein n=1 Tax=Elsinoe batatas TaxID=2601811 RepID=A0A8K0PE44_9PEZI|nr:hypothetical protein KVT40_008764 [Elsinoe batatas]
MRSRTGCLTCRNRKLKCDEQKPVCGQCQKARRECKPSPGIVFRHQQNASLNSEGSGSLERFYGYKESFGKESVWVDVPQDLTFVHISDPYSIDPTQEAASSLASASAAYHRHPSSSAGTFARPDRTTSNHALETLSAVATGHGYTPSAASDHLTPSSSQPGPSPQPPHSGSVRDLNYILNQNSPVTSLPSIDPQLNPLSPPTGEYFILGNGWRRNDHRYASEVLYKNDDDISFLLRHFSRGPGHWMDLFDLGRFFEMDVPIKAAKCPLLLYAAVALAAKSLGRLSPLTDHLRNTGLSSSEWLHKARTYYDKAITYLRQALAAETRSPKARPSIPSNRRWSGASGELEPPDKKGLLPHTDSDELVGTTAILCVYEFLDASGDEWSRHLDGAKSLFDIAKEGVLNMPSERTHSNGSQTWRPSVNSRIAIFWNIARQDMLDAFINNTASRLNTGDVSMWRSVGLNIADSGFIIPSNDPERFGPMQDDMVCNALVWLVMQLVNFIAAGDDVPSDLSPFGFGMRQRPLLNHWEGLVSQFDIWFDGLPDSFRPISTSWTDGPANNRYSRQLLVPKKWFVRPMCASTMQWYHFARIQLLHNRPHLSTGQPPTGSTPSPSVRGPGSLAERHLSYARTLWESKEHAREIISIGLAQSDEGVLVHSVQPLYAAGQVLHDASGGEEAMRELDGVRQTLVDHLRWIEKETGWATEYRVRQLLDQWTRPAE